MIDLSRMVAMAVALALALSPRAHAQSEASPAPPPPKGAATGPGLVESTRGGVEPAAPEAGEAQLKRKKRKKRRPPQSAQDQQAGANPNETPAPVSDAPRRPELTPPQEGAKHGTSRSELTAAPKRPEEKVKQGAEPASEVKMGSFGLGLRFGLKSYGKFSLSGTPFVESAMNETLLEPANRAIEANAAAGGPVLIDRPLTTDEVAIAANSNFELTPTMHFGGDGFFSRLDVPLRFSENYTSIGVGYYPLGLGIFIPAARLMPYGMLGFVGSYVRSEQTYQPPPWCGAIPGLFDCKAERVEQQGWLVEGRVALGLKFFALSHMPLSLEVGYSPYALGMFMNAERLKRFTKGPQTEKIETIATKEASSAARAGKGSAWSLSAGIEWL